MAKQEPASIRYKNPGAMKGRNAISRKWGELDDVVLKDGMGQGNSIAVFPSYVAGICAQIDLWRSGRYRNKRFDEAIKVWSGGNWVPSYVKFVTDRVSGMTGKTVINDDFLKGPKGISFLKAQAWHEAGKKYPAPDKDWIEAQKRVFGGAVDSVSSKSPAGTLTLSVNPPRMDLQPAPVAEGVKGDPATYDIQSRLEGMKYFPGELDGEWGGKTSGAISAFINDRHADIVAPTSKEMFIAARPALKAEISRAELEGFTRPIAVERAEATVNELAPKLPEVKAAQRASFWSKVQGWWSGLFGGVTTMGLVSNFMTAKETVDPLQSTAKSVLGDVLPMGLGVAFVVGVVIVAIILTKKASGAANASADASVAAYQEGSRV